MADRSFRLDRRELVAGIGATALATVMPDACCAQALTRLTLHAKAGDISLRPGHPETPIWSVQRTPSGVTSPLRRGGTLEIAFENDLPVAALMSCRGLDGVPSAEPLAARAAVPAGGKETLSIPLLRAGTFLCDLRLLGDGQARPLPVWPLIVREDESATADRDELFLIEDWRLRPDGSAIAPGVEVGDTTAVYTVNGQSRLDISARAHERLRFRFINGCQRAVIALKVENHEVRVMALDSAPAEPFPARNGAIVLAPGGRADAFVDVSARPGSISSILLHDGKEARTVGQLAVTNEAPQRQGPLPAAPALAGDGQQAQLELKGALRLEVALGRAPGEWLTPATYTSAAAPAFRAKAGRSVVLALANRGDIPAVFHLHGHHFRVLDRLDDGWKPFWLDTLAVDAGQTQRIAFVAQHQGRWLMETMATDWAAPRLVRWYSVE